MSSAASSDDGYLDDTPGSAEASVTADGNTAIHKIPAILPHERVFPIQIGGELFKLSGASLSSDAPSYFSQYFLCQLRQQAEHQGHDAATPSVGTLYIDRDPETFRDIALHLQGYHVSPRDGKHFVRLFADAQFYNLPKLISQLDEESVFVSIGHREFQIPRDLMTDPRNSPNYFSLGFATFFSRADNLFPGLDREGLLRPPAILPPSVPNRCADVFADLLRLLRGYPLHIRDDEHRARLLRDARYFHFKGLEQQLLPHHLAYNSQTGRHEITLRLENIQKSGLAVHPDDHHVVTYSRPHVYHDDEPAELIIEISHESRLHLLPEPRVEFFRDTRSRVTKLLEVLATKADLPSTTAPLGLFLAAAAAGSLSSSPGTTPLSEDDLVRASLGPDAAITLDGRPYVPVVPVTEHFPPTTNGDARKRKRPHDEPSGPASSSSYHVSWTITTSQWRLRIQPAAMGGVECVFVAVRLDAISCERARNQARRFLSAA